MPVRHLLATVDSAELAEWMAYEQVAGPLGPIRQDLAAATIALTVARALGGKKAKRLKFEEFLPAWARPEKAEQAWEDMLTTVLAINKQLGGEDRRGDDRDPPGEDGRPRRD